MEARDYQDVYFDGNDIVNHSDYVLNRIVKEFVSQNVITHTAYNGRVTRTGGKPIELGVICN